jgi:hypothetical protein
LPKFWVEKYTPRGARSGYYYSRKQAEANGGTLYIESHDISQQLLTIHVRILSTQQKYSQEQITTDFAKDIAKLIAEQSEE